MDCGFRIADFSLRRTFLVDHGPWSTGRVCERPAIAICNRQSTNRQSEIGNRQSRLVLASASPRRAEILRSLGIPFSVLPTDTCEDVHPGETAQLGLHHQVLDQDEKRLGVLGRAEKPGDIVGDGLGDLPCRNGMSNDGLGIVIVGNWKRGDAVGIAPSSSEGAGSPSSGYVRGPTISTFVVTGSLTETVPSRSS